MFTTKAWLFIALGGFGVVYKGYDDELQRHVAIKLPHQKRISRPADIEGFIVEARVLASLDHPHIVPVHDVGRTEDGLCYVVSKFVEGTDLAKRIKQARPTAAETAELVAAVAEALHHAHHRARAARSFGRHLRGRGGGRGQCCGRVPAREQQPEPPSALRGE